MKTTHSEAQQWWSNLSTGERRLICALARMLKATKPHAKTTATASAGLPSPHPMGRGIKGEGAATFRQPISLAPHSTAGFRKSAKHTLLKEIIRAISNWERGTGCFIKIRIIHQRRLRLAPHGPWLRIEAKRPVHQVHSVHSVHANKKISSIGPKMSPCRP